MNKHLMFRGILAAFAVTAAPFAFAQDGLPATQPSHLTIIQEHLKPGSGAAHVRNEAGWPEAFAKAGSKDFYIGISSMTGSQEAWFLVPYQSYAAEAASMKEGDKDPVLSAELARLSQADGEFLTGIDTIQTIARPDLSLGKFPDVGKIRFYEIMFFSVRQGHESEMDELMKTYAGVRKRVSPDASYRVYTVVAGMPDPTYIVLQSVGDYAEFDRTSAEHAKTFETATPDELKIFDKWGSAVSKSVVNKFSVDPKMSYVPQAVRDSDPDFWK
jgi:hypothetical protein